MTDNDDNKDVSGISVAARISEFWTEAPSHWFYQTEAIMAPQKWSDVQKYQMVVSKLGKEAIQQVTDILINPPDAEKFAVLKKRLLEVYEETESEKIKKLVGDMDLGDQKPSQLLRKMRQYAQDKIKDDTLTILWLNHLPTGVRGVLTVSAITDLTKLAELADKVMENSRPVNAISSVEQSSSTGMAQLNIIAEINKLGERIKNIEKFQTRRNVQRSGSAYRNRSKSFSRNKPRSTESTRMENPKRLCFYHSRFKTRAHKCVQPCGWKEQGNKTSEN